MGAIDQQIAQTNDPSQEMQINNAIEADRSKALNDAFSQSQAQAYQQMTDWRSYQMQLQQQAQQKAQFEIEQKMRELELQKAQQALAAQQVAQQAAAARSSASKSTAKKSTATKTTPKALPSTPSAQRLQNNFDWYQNIMKQASQGKTAPKLYNGPVPLAW
jgi:hypothetical protein